MKVVIIGVTGLSSGHAASDDLRRIRASGGTGGCAIQGDGHQATALTDVSGSMAFINILLFKII